MTTAFIASACTTRAHHGRSHDNRHRLPLCTSTGLARYRDRHQARQAAEARTKGPIGLKVSTFACPDCRGYHLEELYRKQPISIGDATEPTEAFLASLSTRKRRYVLVDIENPTLGAQATPADVAEFWNVLKQQAPGIAPHDHVVVGAARGVVHHYRAAIHGPNVRWVVGAQCPDGADRALLAAIDLRRVARDFDELVIVSGDHAFADLARRAKRAGLSVQVVTAEHPDQHSSLSRELAAVADTHTLVRLVSRARRSDRQAGNALRPAA